MTHFPKTAARAAALLVLCCVLMAGLAAAQEGAVDFTSDRWQKQAARTVEHLGRPSLMGTAWLTDSDFQDGVIEVDIAFAENLAATGRRSYPGVTFRMASPDDGERFWIRPHRSGLYDDVLQYCPVFRGVAPWQLYSGAGCTESGVIPGGEWIPIRIEVRGTQARVFVGDLTEPALIVPELKRGAGRGMVGVLGPADGTAWFSNFRYRRDDTLVFAPPPPADAAPGLIAEWQLSDPFTVSTDDVNHGPDAATLRQRTWQPVRAGADGLVDVSRYVTWQPGHADCVLARTVIRAERAELRKLNFGYSDGVVVCLNGKPLAFGYSAYRSRDTSFLGIIGLNDAVWLPLRKGDNELMLQVWEEFGGWGFMAQDGGATFAARGVARAWETARDFQVPESAAYDPARDVIYVSDYDPYGVNAERGGSFVSCLGLDGEVREASWVGGLRAPTGLAVRGDTLYAVERGGVAVIDIPSRRIVARHALALARFPNDIAVDAAGRLYVSDSGLGIVFRLVDGRPEGWLSGPEIGQPNGLCVDGGRLLIGTTADHAIKAADLATKALTIVARFRSGTMDGLAVDTDGSLLVSHVEGRVYRVARDGAVTKLLDVSVPNVNTADFGFVPRTRTLIIPTFGDGRVVAYRLDQAVPE